MVEEKLAMSGLDLKQADAVKSQVAEASRPDAPGLEAPPPAAPRPAGSLPDASAPAGESADLGGQGLGGQKLNGQAPGSFGFVGEGFGGGSGSSNFYADDVSKSHEYRLETRFGEAESPVLLATNSLLVQAEYEAARRQAEEEREAARATIGRILLFGGIGAAALLGLLMLWKLPAKARVIVPSLAIAAASVVLGLSWIGVRPAANRQQMRGWMSKPKPNMRSLPLGRWPRRRPRARPWISWPWTLTSAIRPRSVARKRQAAQVLLPRIMAVSRPAELKRPIGLPQVPCRRMLLPKAHRIGSSPRNHPQPSQADLSRRLAAQ